MSDETADWDDVDKEFEEKEERAFLEVDLFIKALTSLAIRDRRWSSNLSTLCRQPSAQRRKWIMFVKRNAATGLPMAMQVIAEVTRIRMTG
jgi:hypothetical protein